MPISLKIRMKRPDTSTEWPTDGTWAVENPQPIEHITTAYINTGLALAGDIVDSPNDLAREITWIFKDLEALDTFLSDPVISAYVTVRNQHLRELKFEMDIVVNNDPDLTVGFNQFSNLT